LAERFPTEGAAVKWFEAYKGRENLESVAHGAGEYVRYLQDEKIHTNGVESGALGAPLHTVHLRGCRTPEMSVVF